MWSLISNGAFIWDICHVWCALKRHALCTALNWGDKTMSLSGMETRPSNRYTLNGNWIHTNEYIEWWLCLNKTVHGMAIEDIQSNDHDVARRLSWCMDMNFSFSSTHASLRADRMLLLFPPSPLKKYVENALLSIGCDFVIHRNMIPLGSCASAACGVCHSDLHIINKDQPYPIPCVLLHEIIGEIVEHGKHMEPTTVQRLPLSPCYAISIPLLQSCFHPWSLKFSMSHSSHNVRCSLICNR